LQTKKAATFPMNGASNAHFEQFNSRVTTLARHCPQVQCEEYDNPMQH